MSTTQNATWQVKGLKTLRKMLQKKVAELKTRREDCTV